MFLRNVLNARASKGIGDRISIVGRCVDIVVGVCQAPVCLMIPSRSAIGHASIIIIDLNLILGDL